MARRWLSFRFNCLILLAYISSVKANNELLLRQYLFNSSRYSPDVLPRQNLWDYVLTMMQWTHIRLDNLSEKDAKLSQDITLDLTWTDEYLTWDPAQYGGITSFTTNGADIWTPDLQFFNRLESSFLSDGLQAEKMKVQSDGTVITQPIGAISTICAVDPKNFPADCHRCTILISISKASGRQLFRWTSPAYIDFSQTINGDHAYWNIERVIADNGTFLPTITFYLKRQPLYYTVTIVTSSSVLAALAVLTFFIPIESGERVSYSVTIFLTFMVLMLQVSSLMPESSQSVSAMAKYFLLLIAASLISIVNSVLLSFYNSRASQPQSNVVHPTEKDLELESLDAEKLSMRDANLVNNKPRKSLTWKIYALKKWQKYMSPLLLVNIACGMTCFILCVYATIDLFTVINGNNCEFQE